MAEIDEKAELKPTDLQVVKNLSAMLVSEFSDGLQLYNYFVVAEKIGKILLAENSASILKRQSGLRDRRYATMFELDAETFPVHRLIKAAPLVFINFEARANNGITFIFEDQIWH